MTIRITPTTLLLLLCATLALPGTLRAQHAEALLPLDKEVKTGTLPNGFTYFIRKNDMPEKRVVLYLVNKTGSILETDGQQGLAHFMEHMSFNGTRHFPKNELVDYLQKSGVRFGSDLNATTSFDQTIYQLPLPSDNPLVLRNGLQILRDWAQDATLEQTEIDKERGVVLEERRLGLGVQQRLQARIFPVLTNHSQYSRRLPIGTEDVLKNFTRDTLLAFYHDWYRPDLQALIVVGDVDVADMEKSIHALFGDLKMPVRVKPRLPYSIALEGKNQYVAVTDREIPTNSIQFYYKRRARPLTTQADYREVLIQTLFNRLIGGKLREKAQTQQLPYLNASVSTGSLIGDLDALSIKIDIKENDYEQGVKSVWQTIEAVKRNGFTTSDINRVKQSYLSSMQAQLREKRASEAYVHEYVGFFLDAEASPGIEAEYALTQDKLASVQVEDFTKFISQRLETTDRDIVIIAREADKDKLPGESQIDAWLLAVRQGEVAQDKDEVADKPLLASTRPAGQVIAQKEYKTLGITELTMANGARVVLKPTTFKNDEIRFSAISAGGTSLYANNDFETALRASALITASGVGNFSSVDLQRVLAGKQVFAAPYIDERVEGLNGASTAKDFETALQLVYQYFTSPRADTIVFKNALEHWHTALANRYINPAAVFSDTVMTVLGSHSVRRRPPTTTALRSVDLARALKIYQERFANAGDFCFTFTGNFTPGDVIPLLEKYIGSLPSSKATEKPNDLHIDIPAGNIRKVVRRGTEDRATVRLVLSGDYPYSDQNNMQLEALKVILGYRLVERLREVEGNTYSPGVQLNYAKYPRSSYSFTISFGCSPANVDKLITATLAEMQSLRTGNVSPDDLVKFSSEQKSVQNRLLQENGFWVSYLTGQYINNERYDAMTAFEKHVEAITPVVVKKAAQKYLNTDNFIQFIWLPEAAQ